MAEIIVTLAMGGIVMAVAAGLGYLAIYLFRE